MIQKTKMRELDPNIGAVTVSTASLGFLTLAHVESERSTKHG